MHNVATLSVSAREFKNINAKGDDIWDAMSEFIKEEADKLNAQANALTERAWEIESINFKDARLHRKIEAEKQPLTVDRIYDIWLEATKLDRDRADREHSLMLKSGAPSVALRYFTITNARRNTVHILADDAGVARYIAHREGRITTRSHGNIRAHDTVGIEKLPYGRGIEEAQQAGWPGEIEVMGTKVVHKARNQVYG